MPDYNESVLVATVSLKRTYSRKKPIYYYNVGADGFGKGHAGSWTIIAMPFLCHDDARGKCRSITIMTVSLRLKTLCTARIGRSMMTTYRNTIITSISTRNACFEMSSNDK